MGSELTATIKLIARESRRATRPLHSIEHFRVAWVRTRPDITVRAGATVLVAGNPQHQLAHGLLALLHENAPDDVATNNTLVHLAAPGGRGLSSVEMSATDAKAVYTACADRWAAHVIMSKRSSIRPDDFTLAAECGLDVTVIVRETEVPG